MRRIFYVDREMCGGDNLPDEFDLEEFCEILQGKLQEDIEVVPVGEPEVDGVNRDQSLVAESVFFEALGEYIHR